MYCYKINNSNTIYVYTEYIQDCINTGKQQKTANKKTDVPRPTKYVAPPRINTSVVHKKWGHGKLVEADTKGIIVVAFANKKVRFIYPDAFQQGHLVRGYKQ